MPEPAPADRPLSVGLVVGGPGTRADPGIRTIHCGVRDYAVCLAAALNDRGVTARVLAPPLWQVRAARPFLTEMRAQRFDILHLQYPSIGHRYSLLPHSLGLLGLARRVVVTLHEHSALPRVQRLANHFFRVTAGRIVFTTDYEAAAFKAGAGSSIIPIGSNIPVHPGVHERRPRILYFGQIRPAKGLETFLDLARLAASANESLDFLVLGSAPPRWLDYEAGLRGSAPANVTWMADAPAPEIARFMAESLAAFLPFFDGASYRRGSLIAALSNGLPVIAPFGASTTAELRAVVYEAESAAAALGQIRAIRAADSTASVRAQAGRALAARFEWGAIADRHTALYRTLLATKNPAKSDRARIPEAVA